MPIAEIFNFPAQCPKCRQARGRPYLAATTLHGAIRVGLRCAACQHMWEMEMPQPGAAGNSPALRATPRNAD